MWLEETRGGLLFLCIPETELAKSVKGKRVTALRASKPERGQLWLRKQRRRRRPKRHAPRSNQTGPAPKAGPDHFQRVFRR